VRAKLTNALLLAVIGAAAILAAGCGDFIRNDRAPVTLVINDLTAGEGANPSTFTNTLRSDVRSNSGTIFDDVGRVTMSLTLKDPGIPAAASVPSAINEVTITRFRVAFRRSDGRNTAGVDVPFPFESAVTFRVPASGTGTATFELIRHTSKVEAPLVGLAGSSVIISTVADVTFSGRDRAGNEVSVTGSLGVLFGDFSG